MRGEERYLWAHSGLFDDAAAHRRPPVWLAHFHLLGMAAMPDIPRPMSMPAWIWIELKSSPSVCDPVDAGSIG